MACAAAAALAIASVGACSGSSDDDPGAVGTGGTLVYLVGSPIPTLDPQRIYTGREITNLGRTVYRSLVAFPISDDPGVATTPVPDLATDTGTPSEGGRTWSFTIKDGVRWEDGRPITCEDFRYGASRVFATDVITGGPTYLLSYLDIPTDPATGRSAYAGPYTGVGQDLFDRAVTCDGDTITYHFNKPWPDFPLAVAALHMVDPYRRDKDDGNRSRYQVFSSGPYRLEGSWDRRAGGVLVRNENYDPETDSTSLRRALPGRIVFELGVTPELQYDRLVADRGRDRCIVTGDSAPPSAYGQVDDDVALRSARADSPFVVYLAVNFLSAEMADPVVRRALALATNADAFGIALGGDRAAAVAESIVSPLVVGYRPNPAFSGSNSGEPEGARRLLADAGVPLPVPLTLSYLSTEASDRAAAALKDTWDRAGFEVTLEGEQSFDTDAMQRRDKESDVILLSWGADWPSALTVTPPLFDSRPNLTADGVGQDTGAYESDEFNELVDRAQQADDLAAQTAALQAADVQLGRDVAYIPLVTLRSYLVHGSGVTGFLVAPTSGYPDLGPVGAADGC